MASRNTTPFSFYLGSDPIFMLALKDATCPNSSIKVQLANDAGVDKKYPLLAAVNRDTEGFYVKTANLSHEGNDKTVVLLEKVIDEEGTFKIVFLLSTGIAGIYFPYAINHFGKHGLRECETLSFSVLIFSGILLASNAAPVKHLILKKESDLKDTGIVVADYLTSIILTLYIMSDLLGDTEGFTRKLIRVTGGLVSGGLLYLFSKSIFEKWNCRKQVKEVEDSFNCSFEPSNLPLSVRRSIFEQGCLSNEMQKKQQAINIKIPVAQRAAMFENGPRQISRSKSTNPSQSSKVDNGSPCKYSLQKPYGASLQVPC